METAEHRHAASHNNLVYLLSASIIFGILTGIIFYTSWIPNAWLIGWDNLLPEFNFPLNIARSLSAVWQEYQSTGLLGGMGHASALPRELVLWLLSGIIPIHMLRYVFTGLMLWLGMMGIYMLARAILRSAHEHQHHSTVELSAIVAGIYYLTNLATVQIFRAPFEAFVMHYAALPWLLWGTFTILVKPSKKALLLFAVLNFLLSTQGYIPTLFLVSIILITVLCLFSWISSSHKKELIRRTILIYFIVCTTNAYWLIPSAFFTVTKSAVTVHAKINQMATEEVFLRNKKFGTITDTLTLRNFWFDNAEFDPKTGAIEPMMEQWNKQYDEFLPRLIRIMIAYAIIFGCIYSFMSRKTFVWGVLGLLSFAMLTIDTPPFSTIMDWLRAHIPLLSQFFRFPFTKWGTSVALSYAVLLAFSVNFLLHTISEKKKIIVISFISALLIFTVYPAFFGDFISPRFITAIPKDYTDLFQFMQSKQDGRIAVLPQQTYWDWKYYDWGNVGSGFLWYGIKQPILDRAFDVWSSTSENYYWEISHAIYSKNTQQLSDVLNKYDVRYVLVDEHIVSASHNRSLAIDDIFEMLPRMQNIKLIQSFGKVRVYELETPRSISFVSMTSSLPTVTPSYDWSDWDMAYEQIGPYVSVQKNIAPIDTIHYPFRSLFTKRSVHERAFHISESESTITLESENTSTSSAIYKTSALVYDSTVTRDISASNVLQCELIKKGKTTSKAYDENGHRFVRMTNINQRGCLSFGISDLSHKTGYVIAIKSRHISGKPLLFSIVDMTSKHAEFETFLPTDPTWQTTYFILPPLAPDGLGYNPYISNDSIGRQQSINDIESLRIYTIPYEDMIRMRTSTNEVTTQHISDKGNNTCNNMTVRHPNTSFYEITDISACIRDSTLILSQSFDDGWIALTRSKSFPFVEQIGKHVLVNNWENGWTDIPSGTSTVYLFFWPQLLEWIGFLLLPIPFLLAKRLYPHQ